METTKAAQGQTRVATAQDLEEARPLIERLYKQMTLPELMDTIKSQCGLKTTVNMLKKRIGKWGLDNKKNNEKEMKAVVRKENQRSRVGKSSTFQARGRVIKYKDVVRYWKRKHMTIEDVLALHTSRDPTPDGLEVMTPVQSPIPTPTVLAIPESMLTAISEYVRASFESGMWVSKYTESYCISRKDPGDAFARLAELCEWTVIASTLFNQGKIQEAGQTLINKTADIPKIVLAEDPALLPTIIVLCYLLNRDGHLGIGLGIMRHVIACGEELLCQKHPLSQILAFLATVDISQLEDVVGRCLYCIGDLFEFQTDFTNLSTLQLRWLHCNVARSADSKVSATLGVLDRLESLFGVHNHLCQQWRLQLAFLHIEMNLLAKAEEIVGTVLSYSGNMNVFEYGEAYYTKGLDVLARVQFLRHDYDAAEALWREAIARRISYSGEEDWMARQCMLSLESMLRRAGQQESAAHIERNRTAILAAETRKMQEAEKYDADL